MLASAIRPSFVAVNTTTPLAYLAVAAAPDFRATALACAANEVLPCLSSATPAGLSKKITSENSSPPIWAPTVTWVSFTLPAGAPFTHSTPVPCAPPTPKPPLPDAREYDVPRRVVEELLNAGLGLLEHGDRMFGVGNEPRVVREAHAREAEDREAEDREPEHGGHR